MEQIIKHAETINWWHSIPLTDSYTTIGRMGIGHCSKEAITSRFGMPENLTGKSVLDIGAWDGLFSFEAEKRGATVIAVDPYQGEGENSDGFKFAKKVLNSKVELCEVPLVEFDERCTDKKHDISFYFGVLYHVQNPVHELKRLRNITLEYSLIETAISQSDYGDKNVWEFNNGFDGDNTNFWYPSLKGLESVLKFVGFSSMQIIYNDGIRTTVKAIV